MSGPGHNGGPTMEGGAGWRRYAWGRARAELLPKMPIEVVRRRVQRAREVGIDYKTYAGIRAATGRDVIALLFSTNALRLAHDARIEEVRANRLAARRGVEAFALVQPPQAASRVAEANSVLDRTAAAPTLRDGWAQTRAIILDLKGSTPADGIVVIGETALEREWVAAGRLAGWIDGARYFDGA